MTELERLDPEKILATARRLHDRIDERFPGSGLSGVADQLVLVASHARETCAELARPNLRLRIVSYAVIALVLVAMVAGAIVGIRATSGHTLTWAELVQVAEAGANDLVLLGAAIYFFVSFETRLKRGRVVKALHQLRTLAHLIDAHQLTKTPDILGHESQRTKSSPERRLTPFQLTRYLDYCIEMLSLTSQIAALYGDGFDDSEALEAVNEIEEITVGLQSKIWQKLILIHTINPTLSDRASMPSEAAPTPTPATPEASPPAAAPTSTAAPARTASVSPEEATTSVEVAHQAPAPGAECPEPAV